MKYFTTEWWAGGCNDAEATFQKYDEYFSSIRAGLPQALIDIKEAHTLHDSEVKRVVCNFTHKRVDLELLGWDINLKYPVRYKLTYTGLVEFEQTLPPDDYVEQELGDLVYWECELKSNGIEMRMLFASGAEFRIVFSGFEFEHNKNKA